MTGPIPRFSYADYERLIREPEYDAVRRASRGTAAKFSGCHRVLDVASGQGFLLESLQEMGIAAAGVDNEPDLVKLCQSRGLTVFFADALPFLAVTEERFDGVNCSHFIEHLPFESLVDLIEGVQRVLLPGGRFVLRWPNPRSLEMQHISFWKDPTHVRFYDGQLVEAILTHYGFGIRVAQYDQFSQKTSSEMSGAALDGLPNPPIPAFRQRLSGSLRRLIQTSAFFKGWRPLLAIRDRMTHPQNVLRHLVAVPLEAEIIAIKRPDESPTMDV